MSNSFRIETDSMGQLKVPADALYKAQTQRAVENFPISGRPLPAAFIRALALVKRCAAETNIELGFLNRKIGGAIGKAAREIEKGAHLTHFPIDVFQTGSGTSTNMNMNEVLATLASQKNDIAVNPNDHVNMGQSSNDVIPTTIHVAAVLETRQQLLPALAHLVGAIEKKAKTLDKHVKTGRTHLMDAMPVRLSQELDGWALQIKKAIARINDAEKRLLMLAQGGTAVGTGINTEKRFSAAFANRLKKITGAPFTPNASFFESLSAQDAAVELSGQLKTVAVSMMKIANDLRWMNSGPLAGLGEIELLALQPGSSIMPGKVNPVIPEAACMVAARVIGNDATITIAGQSGNFQLNVMLPLIADSLLDSIQLLSSTSRLLADKAIASFKVRPQNMEAPLEKNPILVTALNPVIGYLKAAEIAKRAYKEGRPILDVATEETDLPRKELLRLLNPAKLTKGGIKG
ncbi:class II fumarate hydratase [Candidatus Persebacteraceae bacterium Df01]|jgi:fumarate hydratase class II|uniref:Fumarate hydratase class II n=1 Tax=Candidatus Doriopsillibacter californiensis TaxID=2970740 RepID=A0ABT7QLK3_9GAMM|nr:class II fumarate hydratase [Candidatus Persebacteraceae bacterium Df01]